MIASSLRRILVVEDDPDIRAIIKLSLERVDGFVVKMCADGREALNQAASFSPDLILLDMKMPQWNGLTVFKVLRKLEQTAKTPIIFLTAEVQPRDLPQYKELGAEVIAKPFNPVTLVATIQNIWQRTAAGTCGLYAQIEVIQ